MPCERCSESKEKGQRFCEHCGEFIGDDCERCEECRRSGARFCEYCGRPFFERPPAYVPPTTKENLLRIGFIVGVVTTAIWSIYLIFELLVALGNFTNVFEHLANYTSDIILVIPKIITIWTLKDVGLQIYWVLLVIAIIICLAYLFYKAVGPTKGLVEKKDKKSFANTALFEVCVLFSALYAFEIALAIVLMILGIDTGSLPEREKWIWMFDLLEAPVWEEIITRMLYLGVPLAIYYVIKKKKGAWKCIFGGHIEIDRVALFFIVFSAFMFGAGHLTNWGAWKFIPTFLFGLMAGYLFCKYGVYATVALHFLTDYCQADEWAFGSNVIFVILAMITALACAPYLYVYAKRGILHTIKVIKGVTEEVP